MSKSVLYSVEPRCNASHNWKYCKLEEELNACLSEQLFCCSQVTPNFARLHFTPRLLDVMHTNKIDHFTGYDGDSKIMFESIFMIEVASQLQS